MVKLVKNESGYYLEGSLIYDSITPFLKNTVELETTSYVVEINCEKIKRIDSAGIAVFIAWQRWCEQNNKKLMLNKLPQQAKSLIKANKLEPFFSSL